MRKWMIILAAAVFIFGVGFGVQRLTANDEAPINEKEAAEMVRSLYGGDVTEMKQNDHQFLIEIQNQFGTYRLEMNRNTGDIQSLHLIQKNQTQIREEQREKIGKKKAAEIALSKVKGEVEDIELESFDGSYAYKVEIETEEQDAIVFVQAYTGEILSFTFED